MKLRSEIAVRALMGISPEDPTEFCYYDEECVNLWLCEGFTEALGMYVEVLTDYPYLWYGIDGSTIEVHNITLPNGQMQPIPVDWLESEMTLEETKDEIDELDVATTPLHLRGIPEVQPIKTPTEVLVKESVKEKPQEHTSSHYNTIYKLTPEEIEKGEVKIDSYLVSSVWKLFEQDGGSGILFHILKGVQRYGKKKGNSKKREREAIKVQADNLERFE